MMAHPSAFGEFLPEINTSSMHGLEIQAAGMDLLGIPPGRHQNSTAHPMRGLLSQDFLDVGAEALQAGQDSAGLQLNGGLSLSLSKLEQSDTIMRATHGVGVQLNVANPHHVQQQFFMAQEGMRFHSLPFHLRYSKYLTPAQELLNEFCNLGEEQIKKRSSSKAAQLEDGWTRSLCSMDLPQLQKIKSKLLYMLEEVDKRYRRYCEQMKAVRESFEAMAGEGAARAYSALASKAMSKHFRCLRDAVVARVHAVKKAIGEKDPSLAPASAAGASSSRAGETPRLKLLDQYIRRQKAFQQGMMEHHPWRPQRGLPEQAVSVLRSWLFEHFLHPYPSDMDKHILARQAGLSRSQVSNWFINARVRLWKPMVEEMYAEELKEMEAVDGGHSASHAAGGRDRESSDPNPNNPSFDPKPSQVQLLGDEASDSLSSVINGSHHEQQRRLQASGADQGFGVVSNLDFAYSNYGSESSARNGVSLTLGLQQHSGEHKSAGLAAFDSTSAPRTQQHSSFLLHKSDRVEDAGDQDVQFSLLDWETQSLIPYRNMMLHDLAGNTIR